MNKKIFLITIVAGLSAQAEMSVKNDQCMAQGNKLLQEYQLGSFDKPNKDKSVEKSCIDVSSQVKALREAYDQFIGISKCPSNTEAESCFTKEERAKWDSLHKAIEKLQELPDSPGTFAERNRLIGESNDLYRSADKRRPNSDNKVEHAARQKVNNAEIELGKALGVDKYSNFGRSNEAKYLMDLNVTSVCTLKHKEKVSYKAQYALADFEYEQRKYINANESALYYESVIADKIVPESAKQKEYIPELAKYEKDAKYYREKLRPAHLMMKKLSLESAAVNSLQADATVYITDNQVSSVQLENGVGAQYDNSCHLVQYSRYGVVVEADCFANLGKKSENYGEVCRNQFQWVNQEKAAQSKAIIRTKR